MKELNYTVTGVSPILVNNPQTVDPFNHYKIAMKKITDKKKKQEEDLLELRRLEVESKVYFDEALGIYVPSTWVVASIAAVGWNRSKIKKADIRASVFPITPKLKLHYDGEELVKEKTDVSKNGKFQTVMLLRQGQVKVAKAVPIFHNWSFNVELEYDQTLIDEETLKGLITYASQYGGFGDFRPTYGLATVEFN